MRHSGSRTFRSRMSRRCPTTAAPPACSQPIRCATPRPDTADCLPKDPTTETYTIGPALAYGDAQAFCAALDMHLVQIDSFAELGVVSALVRDQNLADIWMGATFDGAHWQSA